MFGAKRVGGVVKITVPVDEKFHEFYVSGDSMAFDVQLKTLGIDTWGIEPAGEVSLQEKIWMIGELRVHLANTFFADAPLAFKLKDGQ